MNNEEYLRAIGNVLSKLPEHARKQFVCDFSHKAKNPTLAYCLNIILGAISVDLFYNGDILLSVQEVLTLGGLGLWSIIGLLIISKATRLKNVRLAKEMAERY